MTKTEKGIKFDSDKRRYELIPPEPLAALADVYTIGARKYGDNNYLGGMDWSRIYGALLRHLQAWWQGEDFDSDDSQNHLSSVMWAAFSLYTYQVRSIGTDNRPNTSGGK